MFDDVSIILSIVIMFDDVSVILSIVIETQDLVCQHAGSIPRMRTDFHFSCTLLAGRVKWVNRPMWFLKKSDTDPTSPTANKNINSILLLKYLQFVLQFIFTHTHTHTYTAFKIGFARGARAYSLFTIWLQRTGNRIGGVTDPSGRTVVMQLIFLPQRF
jgi:hypothetical protein